MQACVHGSGVVVFGLETTELIDEATPMAAMEVKWNFPSGPSTPPPDATRSSS